MPARGLSVAAATSTTVSLYCTRTAPEACFARAPVSYENVLLPIFFSTRMRFNFFFPTGLGAARKQENSKSQNLSPRGVRLACRTTQNNQERGTLQFSCKSHGSRPNDEVVQDAARE